MSVNHIFKDRALQSKTKLEVLRSGLVQEAIFQSFPSLTIFSAGSYARIEASDYSDIDMFFICDQDKEEIAEPRTHSFRMFGKMIETIERIGFPKFSNDCQYLMLLHKNDILKNLGSPADDHANYFTARMLLLLESRCLYGDRIYETIVADIVKSYFKDYPDHKLTFQPVFLINDITRFWKTLLLNYENKRDSLLAVQAGDSDEERERKQARKTQQKVRNFKLKYSRMTTCFATIAALGSYHVPVTEEQIINLTRKTPRERIQAIPDRIPGVQAEVDNVLNEYAWFLEMTGHPTEELEGHFKDRERLIQMFKRANDYGDTMFALLQKIDDAATDPKMRLLRYLVI